MQQCWSVLRPLRGLLKQLVTSFVLGFMGSGTHAAGPWSRPCLARITGHRAWREPCGVVPRCRRCKLEAEAASRASLLADMQARLGAVGSELEVQRDDFEAKIQEAQVRGRWAWLQARRPRGPRSPCLRLLVCFCVYLHRLIHPSHPSMRKARAAGPQPSPALAKAFQ